MDAPSPDKHETSGFWPHKATNTYPSEDSKQQGEGGGRREEGRGLQKQGRFNCFISSQSSQQEWQRVGRGTEPVKDSYRHHLVPHHDPEQRVFTNSSDHA